MHAQLDKAVKDKKCKNYEENFAVEIEFVKQAVPA